MYFENLQERLQTAQNIRPGKEAEEAEDAWNATVMVVLIFSVSFILQQAYDRSTYILLAQRDR